MDRRFDQLERVPEGPRGEPALAYADRGPRVAEAVVLLHSLGTDHRLWAPQLEPLSAEHRVLVPDSRGHGASGWPRTNGSAATTIDDWTADLARLLDHAGVERAVLVGVSMGGVQALAFALRHPTRTTGLVLADTFAELDADLAATKIGGMSDGARSLGMPAYADGYVAETFTTEPPVAGAADVRDAIAGMSVDAYAASVRACFGVTLGARLGEIDAPTLVLWGDRDKKTPRPLAERLAADVPGAVLREVPDAGHLSNLENPAAFTAAVHEHLAEVMPRRADH
ncbi:MAG: alpha/beta fold hydrolase [Streptosporangiales bacterium]|nr:alpha/beta fold hydrolase [Streptosporangiales bacterium]